MVLTLGAEMERSMRLNLSIFHTNDMHGRLEAMARLSGYARRLRAEAEAQGRAVFFWDAGDAADRRLRLCSITKGAAFSPILNAMGYTLQTMGNAISLPYGPQALEAVATRADFPILAANCRDGDGPLPEGLDEYVLISLPGGLNLGVIGLTAPWGGLYESFGLHMPDFCDVARDLVGELRGRGAQPVAVLSHLGLEDDRRLADTVPGIDLIIGAHSHHRLPSGEERNGVLIAQVGDYAQALGRVDLMLDAATGQVLARSAQVLEVPEDEPPDPALLIAIAAAEKEVEALMAQPVGVLETGLDLDHFRECGVGNLTADALRERMEADVALVASGLFHQPFPAGTISLGQLDATCFSSANPGLTEVDGALLLRALERGLDPTITQTRHHSFRGTPVGIPQISGVQVEYDPEAEVGQRVRRVLVGGRPLDHAGMYRVAHTDAETMPDVGYLVLDESQTTEQEVPTILREVIEDYLGRHSPLPEPARGRWLVADGS
jgi:5'-nucleotidase